MAIIKPKGLITFNPHQNAPNFVLGTIAISVKQLNEWLKGEGAQYLTDYKGSPQLKLQALNGEKGLYLTVDTFKPRTQDEPLAHSSFDDLKPEEQSDSLPF